MDIQEDFLNMQIAYEKNCAVRCNCSYEELKAQLDKSESLFGTRYLEGSPRHENWLLWVQAWQAAKAQAVPEWISVEDSLPEKNANVLLNVVARRRGKPFSCIGFYSVEPDDEPCFILDDNFTILKGVTHWMPLPKPPKAQEPAND